MEEGRSKYTISIKLDEEGNENECSISRTNEIGWVNSSEVMTAVLDVMKGLGFHLPYEKELVDMIEDARPLN